VAIQSGVAQLFIDDHLIETSTNLKRTLRQPEKDNGGNVPVLALSKEVAGADRSLLANGTIVFDTRLKRYVMITDTYPSRRRFRFTSADAINWIHGDDGTPDPIHIDLKHPSVDRTAHLMGFFSFYYDTKDARYPYKGWANIEHWGDDLDGIYFTRSTDGRTWERGEKVLDTYSRRGDLSCREIQQNGRILRGPCDNNLVSHDPVSDRFLGILKFYSPDGVAPGNHLRSRAYVFVDRLDEPCDLKRIEHVDLVPPAAAVNGDLPHDEYYSSTAWRYQSLWLGGLKIFHERGGNYPYSAAGCAFLKLVVSRDGLHWQKVPFANDAGVPEVFIANGQEGGNNGRNDGGYISEFSQGPLRVGDELLYYYGSTSYGKNHPNPIGHGGGGIFRARLRVDGFVSVDGGTLTTKLLAFQGQDLLVNAIGPVLVEVLDRDGKRLASKKVSGDSLSHSVRFEGQSLGQVAPPGASRLRFTVQEKGRLYSFLVR